MFRRSHVGKKAQKKRQRLEEERKYRQEFLAKNYYSKNPWVLFWKRIDFYLIIICFLAISAFPFLKTAGLVGGGEKSSNMAILHTSMGDIEIELFEKDAPKTVENFKKLSNENFYNNLLFHRVIKGFMIQTGDPQGDGTGGPGYQFEDEINEHKIVKGTVAMANSGENTNGSQFFIVTDEAQTHLDGKHTVFGEVKNGMDVVKKISEVEVDENDKPLEPVYLLSIESR